jgi:flagellar motor switch protein FliG
MFTFEDLVTVPPATIREIVSGVDKRQLALALRGANDELRAQIFKSMSSRAVEMLKEDMEVLGPVRSREVAQAQQEILNLARRLGGRGQGGSEAGDRRRDAGVNSEQWTVISYQ